MTVLLVKSRFNRNHLYDTFTYFKAKFIMERNFGTNHLHDIFNYCGKPNCFRFSIETAQIGQNLLIAMLFFT